MRAELLSVCTCGKWVHCAYAKVGTKVSDM
jgi:hypothetical protein